LHYAWINPVADSISTDIGCKIDLPAGSMMLWDDDYAHLSSRDMNLYQASIRTRLREAATMVKGGKIFISVFNDNGSSRQIIEREGFQLYATVVRSFRWGKTTWKYNIKQ
jgi:hypothetical protein